MSAFKCIYSKFFTLVSEYIWIFVQTCASNIFQYSFVKFLIFQIYLHICLRSYFFKYIWIFAQTLFQKLAHPWLSHLFNQLQIVSRTAPATLGLLTKFVINNNIQILRYILWFIKFTKWHQSISQKKNIANMFSVFPFSLWLIPVNLPLLLVHYKFIKLGIVLQIFKL